VCVFVQNEFSDVEDLEEDEFESGFEDMKTDEEYEEELDPHSSKFRAEGQLMAYEEEPNFEGYLSVRVCICMHNSVEAKPTEIHCTTSWYFHTFSMADMCKTLVQER
jgi:hypothetical protein